MNALVRLFADIVLHRKGPGDVPASGAVLAAVLLATNQRVGLALAPGARGSIEIVAQIGVDLAIVVSLFGGMLLFTGRGHRIRQTLAALFGTGALLAALSAPFIWIASAAAEGAVGQPGPAAVFSSMMLLVLLVASLLVTGHIVRSAMDWPYAAGVLVAIGYFAVSLEVFRYLFPEAA